MNPEHPEGEERWFPAKEECPYCGYRPTPNEALVTAKLNNHLFGQVERQHKETQFVKKAKAEKPPV